MPTLKNTTWRKQRQSKHRKSTFLPSSKKEDRCFSTRGGPHAENFGTHLDPYWKVQFAEALKVRASSSLCWFRKNRRVSIFIMSWLKCERTLFLSFIIFVRFKSSAKRFLPQCDSTSNATQTFPQGLFTRCGSIFLRLSDEAFLNKTLN